MQAISAEVRGVRPPQRRASIVKALLASTALVNAGVASLAVAGTLSLVAVIASTSAARADGGSGGGTGGIANGGAGGVGNSGAPGADGIFDPVSGTQGGGGGGAGGGGHGGTGDISVVGAGGAGGTLASPNGAAGGSGGGGGGGGFNGAVAGNGGAGGAGVAFPSSPGFPAIGEGGGGGGGGGFGLGTGGNGGNGGAGGSAVDSQSGAGPAAVTATANGGNGGSGGDGGTGNLQAGSFTSNTAINGGGGGNGGAGGTSTTMATNTNGNALTLGTGGNGGNGGNGGAGLVDTGSNVTVVNTANVNGGHGGAGGAGGDANGTAAATGGTATANATGGAGGNGGAGGDGFDMTGSNVTVTNTSTITGGAGGTGHFGGAANTVNLGTVVSGPGGNGGAGGGGVAFAGAGVSFVNSGTITAGGGGLGGQENSTNGGNVTPPLVAGGFAGAGGTGVSFGGANSTFSTTGTVTGGAGGVGGAADLAGLAGVGGAGVFFAASGATLSNGGQITGGAGGQGGNGGNPSGSSASSGGAGGAGVMFATSGAMLVNSGQITGGDGGAASLFGNNRAAGAGGAGVVGAGLTINNSGGTITGGLDGGGLVRQFAVEFTGGSNFISPGGTITGGIQLQAGSLMPALPGSTVGPTLNVSGPVSLASGSTYVIRVNGSANDSITATGVAAVSGANVAAAISGGSAALGQHTIITASAINGTFAGLSVSGTSSAFLQESLSYDPTHVFLNITGKGANGVVDFTSVAQTTNQFNVASALNSAGNANGFSGPLLNLILSLSASQARAAFTALDGEAGTGAQRAAFRFGDEFLNLMLNPFVDGHFDSAGGGVTGFAPEQQASLPPEMAQAYAAVFKAAPPANFEQRWSLWNAAFGGSGKTSGDPVVVGSTDTRLSTYGFAGGIDYRFSPYTVVGLAAAGGGTNWNLSNALGGGRSDSAQIGAYSRTVIGPAYIAESLAFASHWFNTNRTALGDNLRATFTGESIGARIEGGYRIGMGQTFGITPYAAAQAQAFHSGAYSETDVNNLGFGLAYAAQNATDVRTELGARFDNPTLLGGTPFIIRARLAWAHDFVDTPSLNAAFQTLPFSNFTVFGAAIPHDSALASLGVDWYLNKDWKVLAKFDGEFATRSEIYAGTVALRYTW